MTTRAEVEAPDPTAPVAPTYNLELTLSEVCVLTSLVELAGLVARFHPQEFPPRFLTAANDVFAHFEEMHFSDGDGAYGTFRQKFQELEDWFDAQ